MKSAIIYSTITGNTKKVAEGIWEVMPKGTEIFNVEENPKWGEYDLLILGYWVDRGLADTKMRAYMNKIQGKNLGIFGTLGERDNTDYSRGIQNKIEESLSNSNKVLANFICQGKIDPKFITKWIEVLDNNPNDKKARSIVDEFNKASIHPNEEDIRNAQDIFKNMLDSIEI